MSENIMISHVRPPTAAERRPRRLGPLAMTFCLLLAGVCYFFIARSPLGPNRLLKSFLGPKVLVVSPSPAFEAVAKSGESVTATFFVTNTNRAPIRIIGARSTCGCVVVSGLPTTVLPGERAELKMVVSVYDDGREVFERSADLFCDTDVSVPPLVFRSRIGTKHGVR